jgi:type IV secretion system protein TrbL
MSYPTIRLLLRIAITLILLAATQKAAAADDYGIVMKGYEALSANFGKVIAQAALYLLIILIAIDVVWTVLNLTIKGASPNDILVHTSVRIVWYGFLSLMIGSNYISLFIFGFKKLGETSSGLSIVTPGAVFGKGIDLITTITTNFASAGLAALINPFIAFSLGLSIILILLAYAVMTAQYLMILVQMYFFISVVPLLISFGGLSYGRDFAMKAISGTIVIGIRLLAIYFVLAVGDGMAAILGGELATSGITNMSPIWTTVGVAALLAILAVKVPTLASDIISGSASLSGGDLFGTAAIGAAVGSAVTNGITQVMEKYGLRSGASGSGSISAAEPATGAALHSPNSYVTAAQQFGNSPPGYDKAPIENPGRSEGGDGSVKPVVGEANGLSLRTMQSKHDQELGLTPEKGAGSTNETESAAGASPAASSKVSTSSSNITGDMQRDIQQVLNGLEKENQAPPASVHIPLSEEPRA